MFFALRCRVASLLCSRCVVVLAVACSVEGSSRCFVASLSSACPCRRVCCVRCRCCSLASWPLLLRCCAHAPCHACSVEGSSRCFVSADSRFASCCAPACRWCPALSRGRLWLGCGCGCGGRAGDGGLVAPGVFPLPRGLFSVEGVGVFFGGHKNNPQDLILEGGWGGGSFHAYEQYTRWCHGCATRCANNLCAWSSG